MDLIGRSIVQQWADPAVGDARQFVERAEFAESIDADHREALKRYATGFIQTNIFGLLQYICDTEGDADFGAQGYIGLNVVAGKELLVTPVDASSNFPGKLIDSHNGWIQQFSRHPYVSPRDRPIVDVP
jgi:hypothetical protein